MARKKVWVTWMPGEASPRKPDQVLKPLSQHGLEVTGNNWIDDLERVAWHGIGQALLDTSNADMWLIAGNKEDCESPSYRYGLSLLTSVVREARGASFPIIYLGLDFTPAMESMPTPMNSIVPASTTDQSWPAKVVAEAFSSKKVELPEYRLTVHADPHLGQWFEIGPRKVSWTGIMFGVGDEATITHHGVGPCGQVPSRTVLEYPIKGIKAQVGETEFTAWSVQNTLKPKDSYFVKVDGFPSKLIFGNHPGDDQADVFVVRLK